MTLLEVKPFCECGRMGEWRFTIDASTGRRWISVVHEGDCS